MTVDRESGQRRPRADWLPLLTGLILLTGAFLAGWALLTESRAPASASASRPPAPPAAGRELSSIAASLATLAAPSPTATPPPGPTATPPPGPAADADTGARGGAAALLRHRRGIRSDVRVAAPDPAAAGPAAAVRDAGPRRRVRVAGVVT